MAQKSVLCWLATIDAYGQPNVSPKETFAIADNNHIIIANIASSWSAHNIESNNKVCLAFVDVFTQKGFKFHGTAKNVKSHHKDYQLYADSLREIAGERFPFHSIFLMKVTSVESILAPSYQLYPMETTEASQVENALQSYGVQKMTKHL